MGTLVVCLSMKQDPNPHQQDIELPLLSPQNYFQALQKAHPSTGLYLEASSLIGGAIFHFPGSLGERRTGLHESI